MESIFLQAALAASTPLKIVLKKGIEMSGTIKDIEKYNIAYLVDGVVHTTPKKDISYLSCEGELYRPDTAAEGATEEGDLQGTILAGYRDHKKLVVVNLIGGGSQWGVIKGFDAFTILISLKSGQSLVYKHGIASLGEVRKNRPAGKNAVPKKTEHRNVGEEPLRDAASTGQDQ